MANMHFLNNKNTNVFGKKRNCVYMNSHFTRTVCFKRISAQIKIANM